MEQRDGAPEPAAAYEPSGPAAGAQRSGWLTEEEQVAVPNLSSHFVIERAVKTLVKSSNQWLSQKAGEYIGDSRVLKKSTKTTTDRGGFNIDCRFLVGVKGDKYTISGSCDFECIGPPNTIKVCGCRGHFTVSAKGDYINGKASDADPQGIYYPAEGAGGTN